MAVDITLPHSFEAEQNLLGCMLLDNGLSPDIPAVISTVKSTDFFNDSHQKIYDVLVELYQKNKPLDLLLIADKLGAELDGIGGLIYLTNLTLETYSALNILHYAEIVANKAKARELIELGAKLARIGYANELDTEQMISEVTKATQNFSVRKLQAGIECSDAYENYFNHMFREKNPRSKRALTLPWDGLKNAVPVIKPHDILTLVAQSGLGKTMFAENLSEYWAWNGHRVLFFHLELGVPEMLTRQTLRHLIYDKEGLIKKYGKTTPPEDLAKRMRLQYYDDSRNYLTDEDVEWLTKTAKHIMKLKNNLKYIYCAGWTMSQILNTVRENNNERPVDMVVIDYLNIVNFDERSKNGNKTTAIESALIQMQQYVNNFNIPFLVLSQVDKQAKREGAMRTLTLADALGTGMLENITNVGFALDFKRKEDEDISYEEVGNIKVIKNNAGFNIAEQFYRFGERFMFIPTSVNTIKVN